MPFEIPQKTEQEQRVALGRKAMEAIASYILTVPDETFNMGTWRCGTAACAVGHGMALEEVRVTGLKLMVTDSHNPDELWPRFPGIETNHSYQHVGAAFGISSSDAELLFAPRLRDGLANQRDRVAARIFEYLARTA